MARNKASKRAGNASSRATPSPAVLLSPIATILTPWAEASPENSMTTSKTTHVHARPVVIAASAHERTSQVLAERRALLAWLFRHFVNHLLTIPNQILIGLLFSN